MLLLLLKLLGFLAASAALAHAANHHVARWLHVRRGDLPFFAWGLTLYASLYVGAGWVGARSNHVDTAFTVTTLVVLVPWLLRPARAWRLVRRLSRRSPVLLRPSTLALLAVAIVGMAQVGVYLEFPSDPVVHLERIQRWEHPRPIPLDDRLVHPSNAKHLRFAYVLYHWQLDGHEPLTTDSPRLDWLAAIMTGVLLWTTMRFATRWTAHRGTVWIAAAASLAFFGNNLFNFHRYYVLSGAFWAFVVFLEAMILAVAAMRTRRLRLLAVAAATLPVTWLNHPQEALLFASQGVALGLATLWWQRDLPRRMKIVLWGLCAGAGVVVATAGAIGPSPPDHQPHIARFEVFGQSWPTLAPARLVESLGAVGLLTALLATVTLLGRRAPIPLKTACLLTLWPIFLVMFPPFVRVWLQWIPSGPFYRLMYGSTYWVFLAVLAAWWVRRAGRWRRLAAGVSALVGLALASWPAAPVHGRLPHLLTAVDGRLDGRNLAPAVDHLLAGQASCRSATRRGVALVVSGAYVNSTLRATGRFRTIGDHDDRVPVARWITRTLEHRGEMRKPSGPAGRYRQFRNTIRASGTCFVVFYRQKDIPASWVQATSRHWRHRDVDLPKRYPAALFRWVREHPDVFALDYADEAVEIYRVLWPERSNGVVPDDPFE